MSNTSGVTVLVMCACFLGVGFWVHLENDAAASLSALSPSLCTSPSEEVTLTGTGAYAFDINTDTVLYEKNAHAQMPLASLTKIMTVLVASYSHAASDTVTIPNGALEPEGDWGFVPGELWNFQDLADYTLITSSNDGARALALHSLKPTEKLSSFIARMNSEARRLGLSQTYFLNDTGLDAGRGIAGAYGSAHDVALLLTSVVRDYEAVFSQSSVSEKTFVTPSGKTYRAEHTNPLSGTLPGEVVAKTGFTDLAGGNLAVVVEPLPGRPVALVVLGSTREKRAHDIEILYTYAKNHLKHARLCAP